jgi:hypothetical protein
VADALVIGWRCRSSGVQEFRSSGVQEFRSSGVQEFSIENGLGSQADDSLKIEFR